MVDLSSENIKQTFVILNNGRQIDTEAVIRRDTVWLARESLSLLGWELKPEGLCRDEVCIPVRHVDNLMGDDGVNLAVLAQVIQRPLAITLKERAAYLGVSAQERAESLALLLAPDFVLPDLNGQEHALSDYRGKKVLLVAYASW